MQQQKADEEAFKASQTFWSPTTPSAPASSTMPRKANYGDYDASYTIGGSYVVGQDYNPNNSNVETVST